MPMTANAPKLDTATREALIDLLYRLADDSLALGHRNSEWTGQGPILEEDIAFSSMAQDKLGHALAFYTLLHELGQSDPESLAYRRSADQFHCCKLAAMPRGQWEFSLVRHFFFAEADSVIYSALMQSTYEPLAALTRKLHGEIKYHVMHGRTMMKHIAQGTEEARAKLQAALDRTFPLGLGIFEPTRFDDALAKASISPAPANLCKMWLAEVSNVLHSAGLRANATAKPEHGGRAGRHGPEVADLLEALQRVWKQDPGATW